VGSAGWVDASGEEIFLDNLTTVNVLEGCNLLSVFVSLDCEHFPSEVDVNASFVAFVECNFISVGEFEDFLVRSPVLNSSILCSSSLENVLSQEVLVVKSVEVSSFTLIWEFR